MTIVGPAMSVPDIGFVRRCGQQATVKAAPVSQLHQVYPTRRVYLSSKDGRQRDRFTPLESLHADLFCISRGSPGILDALRDWERNQRRRERQRRRLSQFQG